MNNFQRWLISCTISMGTIRCILKIVYKEVTTISDFSFCRWRTTFIIPLKTESNIYRLCCRCWMFPREPTTIRILWLALWNTGTSIRVPYRKSIPTWSFPLIGIMTITKKIRIIAISFFKKWKGKIWIISYFWTTIRMITL